MNQQQNSLLVRHFWNKNGKRLVIGCKQNIISLTKGKKASTCLKIRFCDFHCNAVEDSHLKMAFNEFNSLQKTFDIKLKMFLPALEMLGRYCMITRDITFASL